MLDMSWKEILPATSRYVRELTETALAKRSLSSDADCGFETTLANTLGALTASAAGKVRALERVLNELPNTDSLTLARYYREHVLKAMDSLRVDIDEMERLTASSFWPLPTYSDLLFSVN